MTSDEFDDAALVGMLAAAIEPVAPPPSVKAALFARLAAPPTDGPRFRFATDGAFAPTPFPGMTIRMLNLDPARKQFSAMIRLEPGAVYPSHAHDGPEECVVLEGELLVGGVRMKAGDYQRAEPGTAHADQWSDTGALLYVTGPASLLVH
jgi:quercetin dioxygenase-like cupin family protein